MRMFPRLLAILLAASACGSTPEATTTPATAAPPATEAPADAPAPPAPPPPTRLVTVTVVSAEVEGLMPNGEQWDEKEHKDAQPIDRTLTLYLKDHPELSDTTAMVGVPIDAAKIGEEARKTLAADPMVLVQIRDTVFRSPVRPRAFNPVWTFPFQFTVGEGRVATDDTVHIHVVDYDGPTRFDTIGSTVVTVADLLDGKVHELGPFGSVKKIVVEVDTMDLPEPAPEPSVFRIAVPGNASWTDTGLDIVAGQRVTIEAADEVCTKGASVAQCCGPEGQHVTSEYNLPGFEKLGHGALVGAIGDTRFAVQRERSFVAPASGRLRLGINDRDNGNNRGSYAVRVTVAAPAR